MPTTHNKMLEAQVPQQASFLFTPLDRLPSKPAPFSLQLVDGSKMQL